MPLAAGDTELASRTYTTRTTALDRDATGFTATAYSGGNAWVGVVNGEVWRFDSAGRLYTFRVSEKGEVIRGLWPSGATVVALVGNRFLTVSEADSVTHLRDAGKEFRMAVPLGDGYVGLTDGPAVVYVPDTGERRTFDLQVKPAEKGLNEPVDSAADPKVEEAPPSSETRPVLPNQSGNSHPAGGRPALGGGSDSQLAVLDPERVAYVTARPYQAWFLGRDGSVSRLAIDDADVMKPDQAAGANRRGLELLDLRLYKLGRVAWHEGMLAIESQYLAESAVAKDMGGPPVGSPVRGIFSLIDYIDPQSGKVVERVDVSSIKDRGAWMGFQGKDLVFLGFGMGTARSPYIAFASAR